MSYVLTFFLIPMLIIFAFSAIVGAVMFCVDIWKWSKRPEKFTTIDEDLKEEKPPKGSLPSAPKSSKSSDIDDIL